MKKYFCISLALLLVGCSDVTDIKPILTNITFTAEMTYYNEYYEMAVDISENGDMVVTVNHPDELKGLRFDILNGEVTAAFNGIKLDGIDTYKTAAVNFLYSPFDVKNPKVYKKDDRFFIKGKCDGGEYTTYITESGLPLKICDNAERFEIIIKNLKLKKEKEP